jgi:hypothetical protein
MPSLLSGGKALAGTTGSNSIFITLPTAQPSLGTTPSTATGFTLVTGANGQLGFTSTLGGVFFKDSIIKTSVVNGDLEITSNGTGTVRLTGNVRGDTLAATTGSFDFLFANTSTLRDLTVTGTLAFTSATSTVTFASNVLMNQNLQIIEELEAFGNVTLNPENGIVFIQPTGVGTVLINPGSTGRIDNINIGDVTPANGRFVALTATTLTIDSFTATNASFSTGTFEKVRITSTESDALTVAGGVTATTVSVVNSLTAQSIYGTTIFDDGTRVISQVIAGEGLSGGGNGPIVALTNTGVLSLIAGTDTAVSTATGNVTVWNTSTFQSVTDRGSTTTNRIRIANGFSQVGTGSGNLGGTWTEAVFIVDGDAGVGGNLYINGDFFANGKAVLTTATVGSSLNQGVDITIVENTTTGELTFNNISTLQSVTGRGNTTTNRVLFLNTSNSTSTTTGAITVAGGVGIAKDLYVDGKIYNPDGGVPEYNYQVYTPKVTVSTSTPVNSKIGDFWIDPSIGVEYQYVPNGTQTVWIQFIGF